MIETAKPKLAYNLVEFLRVRLVGSQSKTNRPTLLLSRLARAARVQLQQLGLLLPDPRQFDCRNVTSFRHSRTKDVYD